MALNPFSLPPLSIPLSLPGPLPNPVPTTPAVTVPTETNTFTGVPSITISFPPPTTPVVPTVLPTTVPVPTTTPRPTTPTVPVPASSSSNIPRPTPPISIQSTISRISHTQSTHAHSSSSSSSLPPSSPESSPPPGNNVSNIGGHSTSTSTILSQGAPPTGQLSPSQPTTPFLENKGAKVGVFSVVAVITLAAIIGVIALVYHRRKRKQFDLEHVEAMVGYQTRAPIDGDDEDGPSSQGHSDPSYYPSQKTSSEEIPSSSATHFMQERHPDDLPVFLPAHTRAPMPEEYDPYRESPFSDYYVATSSNNRYGSQPLDSEAGQSRVADNGSDESSYSHLEPPRRWPQLGQLPPAFGSPSSEISVEYPRPALRVTNGFDDSHA